jgi:hypothetical protein
MAPLHESLVFPEEIIYGKRWSNGGMEYRLIKLNRKAYERYKQHISTKADHRLSEEEWRNIVGLMMSPGWENFLVWPKEPNILCFRKRLCHVYTETTS